MKTRTGNKLRATSILNGEHASPLQEDYFSPLTLADKAGTLISLRNIRLWLSENFKFTILACGISPTSPHIASMLLEMGEYHIEFNVTLKEEKLENENHIRATV